MLGRSCFVQIEVIRTWLMCARAAFIMMLPLMLVAMLLAMKTHELCFWLYPYLLPRQSLSVSDDCQMSYKRRSLFIKCL